MVSEKIVNKETKRLKELNKIDGLIGAVNVGAIIDLFNETVDKKRERDFNEDITDRNKYFLPLWKRALEEIDRGEKPKPKSKSIQIPINSSNKIYLPNNKEIVVK